jgi:hypothetical protein
VLANETLFPDFCFFSFSTKKMGGWIILRRGKKKKSGKDILAKSIQTKKIKRKWFD